MNYFKAVFAILKKDILMELRTKETVNATLVFGVLITLVFSFISEPGSKTEQEIAGGIFWMAVTFSGILGLNKTMMSEILCYIMTQQKYICRKYCCNNHWY